MRFGSFGHDSAGTDVGQRGPGSTVDDSEVENGRNGCSQQQAARFEQQRGFVGCKIASRHGDARFRMISQGRFFDSPMLPTWQTERKAGCVRMSRLQLPQPPVLASLVDAVQCGGHAADEPGEL